MKSNRDPAGSLDEIALTDADIAAMRRSAAGAISIGANDYLRFLEEASAGVPPSRQTSEGWAPFELGDA